MGHFNLLHLLHHDADHLQPFGQAEERMFGRIGCNGNDDFIKDSQASGDNVGVSVGNGIERSRIDTNFHDAVDSECEQPYK